LQPAWESHYTGFGFIGVEKVLTGFEVGGGFFFIQLKESVGNTHNTIFAKI
jgi:hypothetical protein